MSDTHSAQFSSLPFGLKDRVNSIRAAGSAPFVEVQHMPITYGSCSVCGGTGALKLLIPQSQPVATYPHLSPVDRDKTVTHRPEGFYVCKVEIYDCIACNSANLRQAVMWERSGLQPGEREWSLDYISGDASKEGAYRHALTVQTALPRATGFHMFYGAYEMGKSGILKSLVASAIKTGAQAKYLTAQGFINELTATYGDREVSAADLYERFSQYQVLAIDELSPGRYSSTAHGEAALFELLNGRYDRRGTVATLMASNDEPDQFHGYLRSRLGDAGSYTIKVGGTALRIANSWWTAD